MFKKGLLTRDNSYFIIIAAAGIVLAIILVELITGTGTISFEAPRAAANSPTSYSSPSWAVVESSRLTSMAGETLNLYGSTSWLRAGVAGGSNVETTRMNGLSGVYINPFGTTAIVHGGISAAQQVEADRLNKAAASQVNLHGSTLVTQAVNIEQLNTVQQISADRLNGFAGSYLNLYGSTPPDTRPSVRSHLASSSRLTGWALYFGIEPNWISLDVARQIGR